LLDHVKTRWIRIGKCRNRPGRQQAAAAIRANNRDVCRSRLGHDGDRLVGMKAVAGDAGWQHPLTKVLHENRKGDPQRQVRLVQVESDQDLPERLIANQDQRRLKAADERPAKRRISQVLASGDVDVLQVDVGEQRIAGVDGARIGRRP